MTVQALLVDDSPSMLDLLKRLVEADGSVHAHAYLDPLEALEVARTTDYDIVLVDYQMPQLDGISFIRELRNYPRFVDVPVAMITSVEDEAVRLQALEAGATDFLPKRPQATELSVRLRNLIKLGAAVRKLNNQAEMLASEVAAATRKLQEREEEIILRLALAVEYRDNDTGEHTLRVARYSRLIAEELGLAPRFCREIYLAAPLHDVGKVAIPDQILLKPGRLDEAEMATIRTHADIGSQILADSHCELIQLAAVIARGHHERWNGTGYPDGLRGREIPIAARVVAVADVFDALTMKRPYKNAMPLEEARAYMAARRGTEFDPLCIDAFLARWNEVVEISGAAETPAPSRISAARLQPA
ncbi:HD-GYP domain-containing protein [Bradyrhizobium sp. 2TAF24]|uniref:HD-GYP domain-containing protein n=1 Tax=Bradyrhizobium sp. 2TAF24 TaxID=3233011 RepID=UPI003F923E14